MLPLLLISATSTGSEAIREAGGVDTAGSAGAVEVRRLPGGAILIGGSARSQNPSSGWNERLELSGTGAVLESGQGASLSWQGSAIPEAASPFLFGGDAAQELGAAVGGHGMEADRSAAPSRIELRPAGDHGQSRDGRAVYRRIRMVHVDGSWHEVEEFTDNPTRYKDWQTFLSGYSRSGTRYRDYIKNLYLYDDLIRAASKTYDVPAALIKAVIMAESAFNPRARSHAGAQGLMQLIPSTARHLGVTDVWDPAQNIDGGAKYLKELLGRFDGNIAHAVAGYNAGPRNVERHGGVPPIPETVAYVARVEDLYEQFRSHDLELPNRPRTTASIRKQDP